MQQQASKHFRLVKNSITSKISALFITLISFFILFFVYNQITMSRYQAGYENYVSMYYELINMKADIATADNEIQSFLRTNNRAHLAQYNTAVHSFGLSLRALQGRQQSVDTVSFLRSIDNSFYSYQKLCNYSAQYYSQGLSHQSSVNSVQAERVGSYLRQYCDDLMQHNIVNNRQAFEEINKLQQWWLTATMGAVLVLVVIFFGSIAYFRFNLAAPLNELHDAALAIGRGKENVMIQGNYTERTLKLLSQAFNTMSANITKMLQDVKDTAEIENRLLNEKLKNVQYERLLEQANFMTLQSQTNPHFLFNTLNSISRTILLGRPNEAVLMIDAMSKLMRYSLTDSTHSVTLREELDVVAEYLKIQQYRFNERVSANIDCSDTLAESVQLPRFTLQPLVENAVIHGIEPKPNGGHITVQVSAQNGMCLITISDDGVGMNAERCAEIMKKGNQLQNNKHRSIGVYNTKRRLELFTQTKDCIQVHSNIDEGTVFHIALPLTSEVLTQLPTTAQRQPETSDGGNDHV